MMKLRKRIWNKERFLQTFWFKSLIWEIMNCQSAKKWFSRLNIKLLQRVIFVWHVKLKLMMRVSEEMNGLLRNIACLRKDPLKRWEKPVNHNHEKLFRWIVWPWYFSVSLSKAVLKVCKTKSDNESFRGNAWVIKKYSVSLKGSFEKMRESCKSQSRRAVQMNCLALIFLSFFQ